MRKKLGIFMVVAALTCASVVGCAKQSSSTPAARKATETKETETVEDDIETPEIKADGAFDFSKAVGSLTKEEKEIFFKAFEELDGVSNEPIAILEQQVVAGMKYSFLYKTSAVVPDAVAKLKVISVYADLDKNIEVLGDVDFNPDEIMKNEYKPLAGEPLAGGWGPTASAKMGKLPKEVQKAFDDATQTFAGTALEIRGYLGSQIVAGTNHLFVCNAMPSIKDALPSTVLVKVYVDLEGNSSIEGIYSI